MGRIVAIDYGQKRVGIAVTDELQLISSGLTTVHVKDIWSFLTDYLSEQKVDCIVVGEPRDLKNRPSDASRFIEPFVNKLKKTFPEIPVERFDERFTSKMAHNTMIESGIRKQKRQDKALVDKISATILLQSFMNTKKK